MMSSRILRCLAAVAGCCVLGVALSAHAQDEEKHGRKYKAPPETCHITVQVVKNYNGKPIANASIIFHPVKDGKDEGSLELKADPDGKASIDVIPVGSRVRLQVLARGFAPYGESFDLPTASRDFVVKMLSPREQVSAYTDERGKPLERPAGVQEPKRPAPAPAVDPQTKP
jgi:hypothetical protein